MSRLSYLLIVILCGLLFFGRLGAAPLIGFDEGVYAACAREMLDNKNFIVPTSNGEPFFDKPPLVCWLQAGAISLFGANSFAARFPSAVAMTLLVSATMLLGSRIFSRRAGLVAGVALACSILGTGLARMAVLDAAFSLALTVSMGAFLLAFTGRWPRWTYIIAWAGMGLSVMIKGPAGAVLIISTVAVFMVICRKRYDAQIPSIRDAMPLMGTAIFLLIALPWYILVSQKTGGAFLWEFIVHHNIQRALGQDFQHNLPFYSYVPMFVVSFFPWSMFVPAGISALRSRGRREAQAGISGLFLMTWISVVFVVFSAMRSKLPAYIFPIFPPCAIVVGVLWEYASETKNMAQLRKSALAAMITACAIGITMLIAASGLHDPIPGLQVALVPMGLALIVGCTAGYVTLSFNLPKLAFGSLCAGMGLFLVIAVKYGLPVAARTEAVPAMKMGTALSRTDLPACAFRLSPPQPQIGFYAGKPVRLIVDAALLPGGGHLVVVQRDRMEGLPDGGEEVLRVRNYILFKYSDRDR